MLFTWLDGNTVGMHNNSIANCYNLAISTAENLSNGAEGGRPIVCYNKSSDGRNSICIDDSTGTFRTRR